MQESRIWTIDAICVESSTASADKDEGKRKTKGQQAEPSSAWACTRREEPQVARAPETTKGRKGATRKRKKGQERAEAPWTRRISIARSIVAEDDDHPQYGPSQPEVLFVYTGRNKRRDLPLRLVASYRDTSGEVYRFLFTGTLEVQSVVTESTPTLYLSNRSLKPYCGWRGTAELRQGADLVAQASLAPSEVQPTSDRKSLDVEPCWRVVPIPITVD